MKRQKKTTKRRKRMIATAVGDLRRGAIVAPFFEGQTANWILLADPKVEDGVASVRFGKKGRSNGGEMCYRFVADTIFYVQSGGCNA
jgi:hypothetical protein